MDIKKAGIDLFLNQEDIIATFAVTSNNGEGTFLVIGDSEELIDVLSSLLIENQQLYKIFNKAIKEATDYFIANN